MKLQARRWSNWSQLDGHVPGAGRQGGGILSCGGAERPQLTAGVGQASSCGRHDWLGSGHIHERAMGLAGRNVLINWGRSQRLTAGGNGLQLA